ncbi:amidohydrolase family protein [Streptomyces sp. NPDC058534]|uniref:amidohydrolase family protein n=1 Tax=Streptomyces sp. NPDC058534 TaxID=3346541 RepID=UPI003657580A
MTFVDAHHHLWDLAVRDQEWLDGPRLAPLRRSFVPADLAAETSATGVTATVLVETVDVPEETPELLSLAAHSDVIGAVVGWTDLTAPDVADALDALRSLPGGDLLRGIRHQVQGEPDPDWLTRPDVLRGLRDAFGPRRLMFGSDWPVSTLAAGYGAVVDSARTLTAGLDPAERAEVWSGTARRVYRMPVTHPG